MKLHIHTRACCDIPRLTKTLKNTLKNTLNHDSSYSSAFSVYPSVAASSASIAAMSFFFSCARRMRSSTTLS